jgi:hypothetical protein
MMGLSVSRVGAYGESMPADNGSTDTQLHELYARAQAARRQSRVLAGQFRATRANTAEILQRLQAARSRAEQVRQLWVGGSPAADRLRYSAYARLQARLASMPVIEQAKGIIMAQCGWPEEQAFDALRRASQRENIKVHDLAVRIVATTAHSASAQRQPGPPPGAAPATGNDTHVKAAAAYAGTTTRRHGRAAAG